MPEWQEVAELETQLHDEYRRRFPSTWFPVPDDQGSLVSTHICPLDNRGFIEELRRSKSHEAVRHMETLSPRVLSRTGARRIKKFTYILPNAYSSVPCIVATAHTKRSSRFSVLELTVTNMILNRTERHEISVSTSDPDVNLAALREIFRLIRKELFLLGTATPDHYAE